MPSQPVSRSSSNASIRSTQLPIILPPPGPLPTVTTPLPAHGDYGRLGYGPSGSVGSQGPPSAAAAVAAAMAAASSVTSPTARRRTGSGNPGSTTRSRRSASFTQGGHSGAMASLAATANANALSIPHTGSPRGHISKFANSPVSQGYAPIIVHVGEGVSTTRPATSETAWSRPGARSEARSGLGAGAGSGTGGGRAGQHLSRTQQDLLLQRAMVIANTDPEITTGLLVQSQQPLGRGVVWMAREAERVRSELGEVRRTNAVDPLWDSFSGAATLSRRSQHPSS